MIRPTSGSKKIHSLQTLGLPFHRFKLALVIWGSRDAFINKPLLTQVVQALFTRNQNLQQKIEILNFIQNCTNLTWS